MVAYVLCVARDARADDDPEVQLMLSAPAARLDGPVRDPAIPLWPWFALARGTGMVGHPAARYAARLREYADEDGSR